MSTSARAPSRYSNRHSVARRRPDDASEEHTFEYLAVLRELTLAAHRVIGALKANVDADTLSEVVRQYVGCALRAGISRARIRDALELFVHDHGGDSATVARFTDEATHG